MGESFGVIPLNPLKVYSGPSTNNVPVFDPLFAQRLIRELGYLLLFSMGFTHTLFLVPLYKSTL